MRTRHPIPTFAVALSLAGCGPAPVPEAPPAPAPAPAPPPAGPTIVSPARWLERHTETLEPTASRKLPGGAGILHGSDAGERWITPEGAAAAPPPAPDADGGASSPHVETAPFILPERIVGILPVEQRWAFFGSSGRVFVAATPLGAIDEVRPAPAPVRSVSTGSAAAVAATQAGDLLRTTDGGAHWAAVQAPGLSPAVPYAIALRPDGVGVVLAAPQRALVTTDDGATWAPIILPAGGPHALDLSEEGDLWLGISSWQVQRTHRLDGKRPTFVARPSPPRHEHPRKNRDAARYEADSDTQRVVVGKRVLSVGRPYNGEPWRVQVSELDKEGEWKALHELEGCVGSQISAAGFGDELVLGCARPRDKDAGAPVAAAGADAGAPAPFRMVFYRSKDGGASWTEDGEVPLWDWRSKALAGPDGFLAVRRRCNQNQGACTPLAFRPAAGQPFVPVETSRDIYNGHLAIDPARRRVVALSSGGGSKAACFDSWSFDGHAGKTTELFPIANFIAGDITVDEHGAIVIVTLVPSTEKPKPPSQLPPAAWKVLRSTDEGATFESQSLADEIKVREVALAGDRGLLLDTRGHLWETASSGRTWVPVVALTKRNGQWMHCGREGCAIGAENRLGWDLASATSPAPALAATSDVLTPVPGATPLRCSVGEPMEVPRVLVDDLDNLAVPASTGGQLAVPAASKKLGLEVVLLSAAEGHVTAKATGIFDAPPNPASVGSITDALLTPAGLLASRSTYPVDGSYADVWHSPVSAEIAWWRPRTGKVAHGRLPPLGKGYMRGKLTLGERNYGERNELLSLTADSAVYRPALDRGQELFTFPDKGALAKITSGALQGANTAVRTPAGLALFELPSPQQGEPVARFAFAVDKKDKAKKDHGEEAPAALWMVAPPGSAPVMAPLQRGNEGAIVVAWSGPPDGPAHGYLIPVRADDAPPEVTDLGLASLLVEKPRACGETLDPASARIRVDLPRSARRAMLVQAQSPLFVRVESVMVVVPPQGQPCVTEWIGRGGEGNELAIIPVAAPQRAWVIAATPTEYNDGVRSRNLSVYAARCEEAAGLQIPASFAWKGF